MKRRALEGWIKEKVERDGREGEGRVMGVEGKEGLRRGREG